MACKIIAFLLFTVLAVARADREEECTMITNFHPNSATEPVCATDGNTYMDSNHVNFENCMTYSYLRVKYKGACEEGETPKPLMAAEPSR